MDAPIEHRPAVEYGGQAPSASLVLIVYVVAFITGAIVMSFEMLGSRYLGPFFGSGIFTWASLISTVLAALCVGYFLGGAIADRHPSVLVLAGIVAVGSVYLVVLPTLPSPCCNSSSRASTTSSSVACSQRWRSCFFRSPCSAPIRHSPSAFCCLRGRIRDSSPAPSMASPPPAASSARWGRRFI